MIFGFVFLLLSVVALFNYRRISFYMLEILRMVFPLDEVDGANFRRFVLVVLVLFVIVSAVSVVLAFIADPGH